MDSALPAFQGQPSSGLLEQLVATATCGYRIR